MDYETKLKIINEIDFDLTQIEKEQIILFIKMNVQDLKDIVDFIVNEKSFSSYDLLAGEYYELIDFLHLLIGYNLYGGLNSDSIAKNLLKICSLLEINDEDILKNIKKKIEIVLSIEERIGYGFILKRDRLLVDKDKVYHDAETLFDIRPVYDEDRTEILDYLYITDLKINYSKNDVEKNIYISLTERDIENLITTLEIAQDKLAVLKGKNFEKG